MPRAHSKAKYTSPTTQHPHRNFMNVTTSMRQKKTHAQAKQKGKSTQLLVD